MAAAWAGEVLSAETTLKVHKKQVMISPPDEAGSVLAWDMWGQNSLEATSSEAHLELLSTGICPVLVDPWRKVAPGIPLVTIEDPLGVYVEHDPADSRTRLAALKRWEDDDQDRSIVVLYLPDRIEWWRTVDKIEDGKAPTWQMMEGQGGPNPLQVVPMVELRNAPWARAEHEGIIDQLDQLSMALYRMVTAAHYTSYRQKWATGIDDEEEGVELDASGNPLTSPPAAAKSGPDTVTTSANEQARFGSFEQGDMLSFIREIEMHQNLVATISSTPHRLLVAGSKSVPQTGEAIRLEDLPLTQKISRKFTTVGNGWETVTRLMFLAVGDQTRARRMDMEAWWADPEPHTLSELMDGLTKAQSFGVPQEEIWRRYGATPAQIREWKKLAAAAPPPPAPVIPPGSPPTPEPPF